MPRLRFRLASAAALCALPALAAAQGQPSFGTYVSIGDSLAAGFESGGLVQTHQVNSVPALLARQAAAPDFQLPLVSEPGIPPERNFRGPSFAAARLASLVARLLEAEPGLDVSAVRARLRALAVAPML